MEAGQVHETPRHSVSVAAVIFDDTGENVLLIKRRDNGNWEPPGGVLELDESIEDGLRREVREETGVEIEVGTLTGVYKNMNRGIIALVFRCQARTQPAGSTVEAERIQWRPLTELPELMSPAYRVRVTDAAALPDVEARIRQHDGVFLTAGEEQATSESRREVR